MIWRSPHFVEPSFVEDKPPANNLPWVMAQRWQKLLFAHWPVPSADLKALLPPGLQPDLFEGEAWISIVPFQLDYMARVAHRLLPWKQFLELNLRTYVRYRDQPGVYFFCLDATDALSVWGARRFFKLAYFNAQASLNTSNSEIRYQSRRKDSGFQAALDISYRPTGKVFSTCPGQLDHWLTSRYRFFSTDARHQVYEGHIHHAPWQLQPAEAEIHHNTMAEAHGLTLPARPPILHYSDSLDVIAWPVTRINP